MEYVDTIEPEPRQCPHGTVTTTMPISRPTQLKYNMGSAPDNMQRQYAKVPPQHGSSDTARKRAEGVFPT